MRLGELIRQLKTFDPTWRIRYSFARFVPDGIDSYRGSYDQLALGWKEPRELKDGEEWGDHMPKVGEILKLCEDTIGKTLEGYKGGWFPMSEKTVVWVANWGDCHDTGIAALHEGGGHEVVIDTAYQEHHMEPEMMADMVGRLHGRPGKFDTPPPGWKGRGEK